MYKTIPALELIATEFQSFDHGNTITQWVERIYLDGYHIEVGDRIPWGCAQFDGIAEIVHIGEAESDGSVECTLKKIS